jgi:tetratricopeptide (TPR) repeat protein
MTMKRSILVLPVLVFGLAQTGCGTRPIESVRTSADFQFQQQEYQQAALEYSEIADRAPGDWQAQYRLGVCELELGNPDRARTALEIAYARQPANVDVVDAMAEAMYRQRDEQALFELLTERAENERTVRAWLRLGRYSAELGDADTALTAFETAIELDAGRSVDPYIQTALFSQKIGDLDGALRRLRQAYKINPDDPVVDQRLRDLGEVPGPTLALPPGR